MELKISIITVCYNCEKTIEQTINSVLNQTYRNIEYIIVDGDSKDETKNIIGKYKKDLDIYISEPDKGIYDAMNKGVSLCSGDIIYFINSGDTLCTNNTISDVMEQITAFHEMDIFYGDILYYNEEKKFKKQNYGINGIIAKGINHQSLFSRRNVFLLGNFFNTNYKIYADYDWLLNLLVNKKTKYKYLPIPIANYLMGGVSDREGRKFQYERDEIFLKYLSNYEMLKTMITHPKNIVPQMMRIYLNTIYKYLINWRFDE